MRNVVWALQRALLSVQNLHCCLAVRMNRESAGCVRVSAWGLCPKAPFSACHNKVAQGLVFPGSLAIFYYSTLHNKKHLLISADQRPLLKQEKGRKRGGREREKIEKP
uniref:Secreted protein n=1 Tax=Otus sunia TaxID=257818 RepID=A0A8C8E6J3_9STRI